MRANLRTCGCEPDTSAAIDSRSPPCAAAISRAPGQVPSATRTPPPAQDGDTARAHEHGHADHDGTNDHDNLPVESMSGALAGTPMRGTTPRKGFTPSPSDDLHPVSARQKASRHQAARRRAAVRPKPAESEGPLSPEGQEARNVPVCIADH
ncbi:hypothetical protein GCM10010187_23980 [Actinomadura coerulea]|nr:hypothetical protein GCM10010187_23980 [Actinomadura coerulea]